jgi:hypothetical protein
MYINVPSLIYGYNHPKESDILAQIEKRRPILF